MIAQRDYSRLKGRLTRAKNSGDPQKVMAEVRYAVGVFNSQGWPDNWPMWRIALEDAYSPNWPPEEVDELFDF